MKKIVYFLFILFISGCSFFVSNENFDYFENDLADLYIPKGYTSIIVNSDYYKPYYEIVYSNNEVLNHYKFDYNKPENYFFLYPDSSFFFIGKGGAGDLHVTEMCCDTVRKSDNSILLNYWGKPEIKIVRGANFPRTEGSIQTHDHNYTGHILIDWYFDDLTKTFRKQIVVGAIEYLYGYHTAGYVCKNPNDTIKFNKALEKINWKYNTNEKHKMKSLYFPFEVYED